NCGTDLFMHGEIFGKGENSGEYFDSPFVKEYSSEQTNCLEINDPVFGGHDIGIDLSTCNFTPVVGTDPVPPVCEGETITLTVTDPKANGTYQWQKNGVNIPNATGIAYMITNAEADDAGEYRVVLTNANCTFPSDVVSVSVKSEQDVGITGGDTVCI